MEEAVNHLTNSQSTAKTMADGVIPDYCTLPRPPRPPARLASVAEYGERQQVPDRGTNSGHFYTLRPQPAKMGAVGGRFDSTGVGSFRREPTLEDLAESNRSLLYEQNMSTFENFCERRNSEQQLQTRHQPEEECSRELGPESLGNFCTLRKVRRSRSGCDTVQTQQSETTRHPFGGAYCTLKKKKLQLNRKFVESFLEDPNAKVADYLSELDAYLDEMDGVDDEVCGAVDSDAGDSASGSEEHSSVPEQPALNGKCRRADGAESVGESLQYYQPKVRRDIAGDASESVGVTLHDMYQEDRIKFGDIKHFCTLPKQKRTQFLNAFKRGASMRRSVVSQPKTTAGCEREASEMQTIPDDCRRIECERSPETRHSTNDQTSTATLPRYGQSWHDDDVSPHHHPSWHRNSMRKKHLIELPEQEIIELNPSENTAAATLSSADSNDSLSGNNELCSITTLPMDEMPERETLGVISSLVVALPPSPIPFVERTDREQIVASAPPASVSSSPAPSQLLETDLDGIGQERPLRQTGRRAQSQPRIGSITVVRDATTNELIICTNSVPGTPTAPPLEDLRPSHQANHHHHQHHDGRYTGESEGSSIGSSRNPSPVSLLSTTTTCSSIASGTDNATDRAHRVSEPPLDGSTDVGSYSRNSDAREDLNTVLSSVPSRSSAGGQRLRDSSTNSTTQSTQVEEPPGTSSGPEDRTVPGEDESEVDASPQRSSRRSDGRPKARWPHAVSRSLATTFCTLGLFNISRFAVFSVHFGANFVVQFLIFSLLFGIPMLWLQMVLGARIRGGPVTMWRISPICKGIGIALLVAQALITLYSAISLAWVLVYFRDAFIMRNEKYRWQEPFLPYRGVVDQDNQSYRLPDTVADYFNGVVLQRYYLAHQASSIPVGYGTRNLSPSATTSRTSGIGAIRFQLAFNMAILWTLVFVTLCRGIRSLGKIVIGVFLGAFVALAVVCAKFLTFINYDSVQNIFPSTDWQDFFLNSRSWTSAAQETFLTWGLLGVSIYAINCRSNRKGSCNVRTRRELRRDAFLVAFITLVVLILAAVLGSACVQILNSRGYYYFPGSYENLGTNVFLRPANQPLPPQHATMPNRWLLRYSTVIGESFKRSYADPSRESGYQALRLVTELFPAALAAATPEHIAPVWGLVGYMALVLFGLGQLCVMWKPIAGAIGDAPSSILLSCVTGLLLGMPLATEGGINIVHYLDTILGAAWWVLLLWIGHILALFLVRGRPFTSDILVNDLQILQSFSAFVAFAWNFLLPIGLIFMCIIQYRLSNSAALFNWSASATSSAGAGANNYWPLWARQVGGFVQVSFLLLVPVVMVIQIYRYLCRGPPDILDRVDLLLRPPVDGDTSNSIRVMHSRRAAASSPLQPSTANAGSGRDGSEPTITLSMDSRSVRDADDAPPKYTPPPSYTTATGARIAKLLRNSIRRSVRRLIGEPSGSAPSIRPRTALPQAADSQSANPSTGDELPPPDYCSALQQYGGPCLNTAGGLELNHHPAAPRILYNSATLGSGRRYRSLNAPGDTAQETSHQQNFTASDVRQILRPGTGQTAGPNGGSCFTQTLRNTLLRRGHSMENLVLAAAPLGDSSIITLHDDDDDVYDDVGNRTPGTGRRDATIGRDSVI
ncbi:sodium-dependent transporter bedraggled [Anopheles marshallii]|uniref:sodium-dependent transporter bedraggled n=1 Tax=Anopheles marshallii TaxID=1521116 RepID=UPI00237BEBB7|nr:sodium-dependent transporter bedraggled [Anopheles marshallii]